ncbi:hypothetical protein TOK_0174 [Pseudonocardia sp. N23]|nr:hypothetical protein TOK_0174 [Pseudonocardia sp. N23]
MRTYAPDGLTETAIDALLAEVDAEVRPQRRATSPYSGRRPDRPIRLRALDVEDDSPVVAQVDIVAA